MTTSRTSAGFPAMFTNVVAEAAMKLPPLTKPEHFEFLKEVQGIVIEGFWERYVAAYPQDVQAEIHTALKNEDFPAVQKWHEKHANFSADPSAAKKADLILDEIAANLESTIKEAYDEALANT
jgi:hypothetical protein